MSHIMRKNEQWMQLKYLIPVQWVTTVKSQSTVCVCVGLMVKYVSSTPASVAGWIIHGESVMAVSKGKGIQR